MLKGHPPGLFVAFFTNMGERFGYYTMLAIFTLYLQAKFGYSAEDAGWIYGLFLFGVYFFPLLGGFLADFALGYGRTILVGLVVMLAGYVLLAWPGTGIAFVVMALGVISLGTGLFKGNLQALVGNMYDDPRYAKNRDNAFNVFYMGINIGAFFAPSAADGISAVILRHFGLTYDRRIPDLAHKFLGGELSDTSELTALAQAQIGDSFTTLTAFSEQYIDAIGRAYNGAFAVAAASMVISMVIFIALRRLYRSADVSEKQKAARSELKDQVAPLTPAQTRERLVALFLVFFVVIFFWAAFHQNGFTMTIFARDYTVDTVSRLHYTWFDLRSFLPLLAAVGGLVLLVRRGSSGVVRGIGAALAVAGAGITWWVVSGFADTMPITPQIFQHFNPIFIVFLTPIIIGLFTWLRGKGKEPSAPRKIGIGMVLAGLGFAVLMVASLGLKSPAELGGGVSDTLISPYWLVGSYFTLTIAELFLSPMGISFVSKVAPPKFKGLMQGGWFAATAVGNLLAGVFGLVWGSLAMWQSFLVLVVCCLLAAVFIFSVLGRLERAASA
jgi:POT family proton-dependent oligopeptide transporter